MALLNRSTPGNPQGDQSRRVTPRSRPPHLGSLLATITFFASFAVFAQVDGPTYRKSSPPLGSSAYQPRNWPAPTAVQATTVPTTAIQPVPSAAPPARSKPGNAARQSPWTPLYRTRRSPQPAPLPSASNYPTSGPPLPIPRTIRETPDSAAARGQIAAALAQNRAQQSADPKNVELKIQEARYLSWLSRHYTAANRYRAILREHPNHADALTGYGTALFWQSNWREAENALAQAISLAKPQDLAPRNTYFRVLAQQGRASEAYRHAMDLDRQTGHQDAQLGMVIADMLGHIGLHGDGLGYASRPTQDPDLQIRQAEYQAKLAAKRNGRQSVPRLAANLVGRHQGQYNAYIAAGDLAGDNGYLDEAVHHYQQAAELSPEREEAGIGRARIHRTRGRHAEALQLFQAAVQANPESVTGWIGVGEMARLKGDYPRAWQALETAHSVAPGSADVYRAKLALALAQNDASRFEAILQQYRVAQPADPYTTLWQNKWAARHAGGVNENQLRGILDPMAPELNAEALGLIQGRTGTTVQAVPSAPSPNLDVAARQELKRRIRTRAPGSVNLTAGYEYSSLKPTTILGGTFPEWHEAFFAGFWRADGGPTLSWDYRHFERFSETAQQLEGGVLRPVGKRWHLGAKGGAALFGGFIPHWRAGANALFKADDRWTFGLAYRHLRFTDNPVHQIIPEVTWNWHSKFSSTGRLYVTHSRPKNAAKDTGISTYFDLAYRVASNSHAKIHYAVGDENASTLIRNLIGEKNFQSAGLELRLGINERWAVIPGYRFERHNLFDLHAVSLAFNGRF